MLGTSQESWDQVLMAARARLYSARPSSGQLALPLMLSRRDCSGWMSGCIQSHHVTLMGLGKSYNKWTPWTPLIYWYIEHWRLVVLKIASDTLVHPWSLTVFEDRVYWSDWASTHSTIYSANKLHGGEIQSHAIVNMVITS